LDSVHLLIDACILSSLFDRFGWTYGVKSTAGRSVHSFRLNQSPKKFGVAHREFAATAMASDHPALRPGVYKRTLVLGGKITQYQDPFAIWAGSAFSQGGGSCFKLHDPLLLFRGQVSTVFELEAGNLHKAGKKVEGMYACWSSASIT